MNNNPHPTKWEKLLDSDERIFGKVQPTPFLPSKIMNRLDSEMQPANRPPRWHFSLGLKIALGLILMALNVATLHMALTQNEPGADPTETISESYFQHEEIILQ